MRLHSPRFWLRAVFIALAAVVINVILFVGWLFLVISGGLHPLLIVASIPVVSLLILSIAQGLSGVLEPGGDEPPAQPPPNRPASTTRWNKESRIDGWSLGWRTKAMSMAS